jgi:hypothetical protein
MKKMWLAVTLLISLNCLGQLPANFKFKTGDIIFQDLDCGPLCDAIEKVTQGYKGKDFSHAGIIFVKGDSTLVLEAIGERVHYTPIQNFLKRSPKVAVGRLKKKYSLDYTKLESLLKENPSKYFVPYDDVFLENNSKYYCTELIHDLYMEANKGGDVFPFYPMTFKDPDTKEFFPVWVDYYKELKQPIPEGQPGCNPGGVSRSEKLKILYCY